MALNYSNSSLKTDLQDQNFLSDSILQNWTLQAIECRKLNGNCKKCSIAKGNYSFTCQMKKVVKFLLETLGEPDEFELKPRHLL